MSVRWSLDMRGCHFQKSEFPSSHHREEGWRRHQENGAKPPYRRRRGGVPCPVDRNTTPSLRKADAARYFLDRSATPPRSDARRGIRLPEMAPNLDSCAFEEGRCALQRNVTLPKTGRCGARSASAIVRSPKRGHTSCCNGRLTSPAAPIT